MTEIQIRVEDRVSHTCHAVNCRQEVPPRLFACGYHWAVLPVDLKRAVLRTYRNGQELDKRPSASYLDAAHQARHWLHVHDGLPVSRLCVVCIEGKATWPAQAQERQDNDGRE